MGVDEEDGFILVRSRCHHKRRGRRKAIQATLPASHFTRLPHLSPPPHEEGILSLDSLQARVQQIKEGIPVDYRESVLANLSIIVGERCLEIIRCLGIGNFNNRASYDNNSIHQLALLELIKERFQVEQVTSQEPRTGELERLYLKSRDINVISHDDLTTYSNGRKLTLFYMIHCEAELYETVLTACWNVKTLPNVIVAGNNYVELNDAASFPHLHRFSQLCKSIPFAKLHSHSHAFNDTAFRFFRPSDQRVGEELLLKDSLL